MAPAKLPPLRPERGRAVNFSSPAAREKYAYYGLRPARSHSKCSKCSKCLRTKSAKFRGWSKCAKFLDRANPYYPPMTQLPTTRASPTLNVSRARPPPDRVSVLETTALTTHLCMYDHASFTSRSGGVGCCSSSHLTSQITVTTSRAHHVMRHAPLFAPGR